MSQLNPAAERSLCHFSSKKATLDFVLACNFFYRKKVQYNVKLKMHLAPLMYIDNIFLLVFF